MKVDGRCHEGFIEILFCPKQTDFVLPVLPPTLCKKLTKKFTEQGMHNSKARKAIVPHHFSSFSFEDIGTRRNGV